MPILVVVQDQRVLRRCPAQGYERHLLQRVPGMWVSGHTSEIDVSLSRSFVLEPPYLDVRTNVWCVRLCACIVAALF